MCASIRLMVNIADSVEFIPLTSKDQCQRFARIALGIALLLTFYELLNSSAGTEVSAVDFFSKNNGIPGHVKHLSFFYASYCN